MKIKGKKQPSICWTKVRSSRESLAAIWRYGVKDFQEIFHSTLHPMQISRWALGEFEKKWTSAASLHVACIGRDSHAWVIEEYEERKREDFSCIETQLHRSAGISATPLPFKQQHFFPISDRSFHFTPAQINICLACRTRSVNAVIRWVLAILGVM